MAKFHYCTWCHAFAVTDPSQWVCDKCKAELAKSRRRD